MLGGDFKGTITCYDCSSRPGLKTHRHSGKAYIDSDSIEAVKWETSNSFMEKETVITCQVMQEILLT